LKISISNRIRLKIKNIALDKKKKSILLSLNAIGGETLCLAENASVEVVTSGKYTTKFGSNTTFWPDVKISFNGSGHEAVLEIMDDVSIGNRTQIHIANKVSIGQGTLISWDCVIMDRDYHAIDSEEEKTAPIIIGEHVLIGNNCIVLKGVTVGEGSVIAAGSVVTHDVPPNSLVAGNPAKLIRSNIKWKP